MVKDDLHLDVLAQLELQLQDAIFDLLEYQHVGSVKQIEKHSRRLARATDSDFTYWKFWKRRLGTVTAEYKKWRVFFKNKIMGRTSKDLNDLVHFHPLFPFHANHAVFRLQYSSARAVNWTISTGRLLAATTAASIQGQAL